MSTAQPVWKFRANLGDANPLDHGGLFVYEDETGVYGFEAEHVESPDDENGALTVHRVLLGRCKVLQGYLVPDAYQEDWAHPLPDYREWFNDSLEDVARSMGMPDLRAMLCSEDGIERAHAYAAVYDYHGWDNGDGDPLTLTRAEAEARYDSHGLTR